MFRRAIASARPLARPAPVRARLLQVRHASASLSGEPSVTLSPVQSTGEAPLEEWDPNMNGRYPDPPRVKRAFRDPYDDWWDKQERRNYNEPLHEDNDILGMFSTEAYTHFTIGKAWVLMGTFIASVAGLCTIVSFTYPDTPTVPKAYPDGLDRELGGSGALLAHKGDA